MDAVTDLAARTVSFISLIQDFFLQASTDQKTTNGSLNIAELSPDEFLKKLRSILQQKKYGEAFGTKALELLWISEELPEDKENAKENTIGYAITILEDLVKWIHDKKNNSIIKELIDGGNFPSPFSWRGAISKVLYRYDEQRLKLADALRYLPLQVVLALGGGKSRYEVKEQRIFQLWNMNYKENTDNKEMSMFLSESEIDIYKAFIKAGPMQKDGQAKESTMEKAKRLLQSDEALAENLKAQDVPLPFELVFRDELLEISNNRQMRLQEENAAKEMKLIDEESGKVVMSTENCDPHLKGEDMKLYALAFSGGGIRSATFNLGILQGLAKKGLISKFDYLSTVSGGGYIGSWLATWICRQGSVAKVSDRLNTDKSPDPFGEELLPVRWLRMFSNYFAPRSSIMSADAWTIGVTWLRNTLLNQLIILLLFLSFFSFGHLLYIGWSDGYIVWTSQTGSFAVWMWSVLLLLPASLLAGLGMRIYYNKNDRLAARTGKPKKKEAGKFAQFRKVAAAYLFEKEKTGTISTVIIILGFIAAYLVSALLFSRASTAPDLLYEDKLRPLFPAAIICFISLFFVAYLGGYNIYIEELHTQRPPGWIIKIAGWLSGNKNDQENSGNTRAGLPSWVIKLYAWFVITLTAAIAALVALYGMAAGWQLIQIISNTTSGDAHFGKSFYNGMAFTFGVPVVLEVFSITVVARMAVMGRYFPDERREWWGRLGALVHNAAFLWILLSGSALLVNGIAGYLFNKWWAGAATVGGWITLVGSAVRAAFSPKTSGKDEPKGALSTVLDLLGKVGPYLFFLGLLVLIPQLIILIEDAIEDNIHAFHPSPGPIFLLMLALLIITYLLARQVGVNEFSMNYFYRNRLVRAYLGATRPFTERQKSANPFTGFDAEDDEKLSRFTRENGYYGPYPVLNTALNASQVTTLDRQDRMAESFIFSPLYCGFDFSKARASADTKAKSYDYGYRETACFAYDKGPSIGLAMAISGAAVNPNQGYHSSPATAFLLTVFNVQMGWWIGNPRKSAWRRADPGEGIGYLIRNLAGQTNTKRKFVSLSDGGHFDNMGLYEMVRRRCAFILLGDGEQDDRFTCEGLANAIRRCRIDFGAEINIDVRKITNRNEHKFSESHYALGTIRYAGEKEPSGTLLYIKSSVTGQEPVDVREYALKHDTFPHQTTADQFFDEEQFESYRKLGLYIADSILKDVTAPPDADYKRTLTKDEVEILQRKFKWRYPEKDL